jgi:hypothetical protein
MGLHLYGSAYRYRHSNLLAASFVKAVMNLIKIMYNLRRKSYSVPCFTVSTWNCNLKTEEESVRILSTSVYNGSWRSI